MCGAILLLPQYALTEWCSVKAQGYPYHLLFYILMLDGTEEKQARKLLLHV